MALYALYLTAFTRARLLLAVLLAAAFAGILLTTNKSTAAAFALALMLLPILRQPLLCRLLFLLVVSLGIALPVLSVMIDFDGHATTDSSLLSSFYDRLVNTWPRVIDSIDTEGWGITGAGLGMVGSSIAMFPVFSAMMPSVTDSTSLYLWSTLGIGGILLFGALLPVMARLASRQDWMSGALMTATFCITLISWTTDVLEVPVASLFLGLAVSHSLMRPAASTFGLPFRAFSHEPVFHAPRTV